MTVHLALAPPDGFDAWGDTEWKAWLEGHAMEPADDLGGRSEWLIFLYMARVHGKRVERDLAPWMERLITERPVPAREIAALRDGLRALEAELGRIPAGRLWTGTQFYTADFLHALILRKEEETGRTGQDLTIADLWRPLFATLLRVMDRAAESERGVYFGHV